MLSIRTELMSEDFCDTSASDASDIDDEKNEDTDNSGAELLKKAALIGLGIAGVCLVGPFLIAAAADALNNIDFGFRF